MKGNDKIMYTALPVSTPNRKRKLEKRWSAEEDHTMIEMIERREAIWNTSSPLYRNRDVKIKSWAEIAQGVNHSILDAKVRWNIIKSRYNAERNKDLACENGKYQSRFELYKSLQFLSKISKRNATSTDMEKLVTKIELNDTCYESTATSPRRLYVSDQFRRISENIDTETTYNSDINRDDDQFVRNKYPSRSISSHSLNRIEDTYDSDMNEPHETSKMPKIQSVTSQHHHRAVSGLNEISGFLEANLQVPDDDRWKRVFSEYIHCELDRYNFDDSQRLKNQLTKVCLDFQPIAQSANNCRCNFKSLADAQ